MGAHGSPSVDAVDMAEPLKIKPDSTNCETLCVRTNFGLPDSITGTFLKPGGLGRRVMALLHMGCTPFLKVIFSIVRSLPWKLKNIVAVEAWKLWLGLHKMLPASIAQRGMSKTLSIESHAMNNVLWWCRLFPMPVWSMRFGLSQLSTSYPPTVRTEWVASQHTPGLRSAYLHLCPPSNAPPRVLCWAFGGAFISGDVEGNKGIAEHYGRLLGCDVFLVDMRLCPEHKIQDAVLDLYRGYEWLLQKVPPENIIMLGISSGGGSCVRVLQLAASDEVTRREYFGEQSPLPPPLPQPAGAILFGAFVDYTDRQKDPNSSMQRNTATDWIVTQSVIEVVLPLQSSLGGGADKLRMCSPLHQSMKSLCPLFVSVSEHECLIDEDTQLAAKAKDAGVDVVLSTTPFMCHVYQLFSRYLPEAAQEEERICKWVRSRGGVWA